MISLSVVIVALEQTLSYFRMLRILCIVVSVFVIVISWRIRAFAIITLARSLVLRAQLLSSVVVPIFNKL